MWGSVVVLALPMALDPVRLGVNLLLISRPRPAQNLLVYWVGCVSASVVLILVPVLVLHYTPLCSAFVHDLASPGTTTSSTLRHVQIFMGVFALCVAALIALRFKARGRAQAAARSADTSTLVLDPDPPSLIERLLRRGADAPVEGESATRRLLGRAHSAWESGSLWVALVVGFWAGPQPALVIFALTTILASGATIGTQITSTVLFILETLVVVEIVLISNLVTPVKTQAALRLLHDWVRDYRRQLLVVIFTLVGLALVAQGVGGL